MAITGIENARNKKLRHYSTGMIHRLGMAMALLHDPDILFLDEPLNGLDPEGIHSIRELLLQLHQEGKTVFLSSHLLDEVEKLVPMLVSFSMAVYCIKEIYRNY